MKTKKKIWILSFICVGVGIIILGIGIFLGGVPGFQIDSSGIHTAGEVIEVTSVKDSRELESFSSMDISTEYADVKIIPSDKYAIEYCVMDSKRSKPVCKVEEGKLVFQEPDEKTGGAWNFTFSTAVTKEKGEYYVNIYVPADKKLSALKFDMEDGKLILPDIKADSVNIKNEYGGVSVEGFQGETFQAAVEDGKLSVQDIQADRAEITNEYGDVVLGNALVKELSAKLSDGDFSAELLESSSVDIENEYGRVTLTMAEEIDAYSLDLATEYGDIQVPGYEISSGEDDEMSLRIPGKTEKMVKIRCEDGGIKLQGK